MKSVRKLVAVVVSSVAILVIGWLVLCAFTRTQVSIHNKSGSAIENVRIDFDGPVSTIEAIQTGETVTRSRSWIGEGSVKLTFSRNGSETHVEFGYITPNLAQDCEVVIADTNLPNASCTPK